MYLTDLEEVRKTANIAEENNPDNIVPDSKENIRKGVLNDLEGLEEANGTTENSSDDDTETNASNNPRSKPQPRPQPKQRNGRAVDREIQHSAERMTTAGQQVTGLTLIGGMGQLVMLGKVLGTELLEDLGNLIDSVKGTEQEDRIEGILKNIQKISERTENLSERMENVNEKPTPESPHKKLENVSTEKPATEPEQADPLAKAVNNISEKLEKTVGELDPENKISPLEIPKNSSVEKKLDKIEDYLNQLNKRLDRLESVVQGLENKLENQNAEPTTNSENIERNKPVQKNKEEFTETVATPETDEKNAAENLFNFAKAIEKTEGRIPRSGIEIDDDTILTLLESDNETEILLKSNDSKPKTLFSATKEGTKEWEILDNNLTKEALQSTNDLPQTEKEYKELKTIQAAEILTDVIKETFPERFESNSKPFTLGSCVFKGDEDKLIAIDKNSSSKIPIFEASIDGDEIEVKKCDIEVDDMEKITKIAKEFKQTQETEATSNKKNIEAEDDDELEL